MQLSQMFDVLGDLKSTIDQHHLYSIPRELLAAILSPRPSPHSVAEFWKEVMRREGHDPWPTPTLRNFALLAAYRAFEDTRLRDYPGLQKALAQLTTLAGRPMNVMGTKCEMASRTAEALFSEARRSPGEPTNYALLQILESLLDFTLSECRAKDNPRVARRWYGIRGVTKLMLTVQTVSESEQGQYERYAAAASDIERSFYLGNRGTSAATYLLDALHHQFAIDQQDATLSRMAKIAESLTDQEKQHRGTLFHLGRMYFAQSFRASDSHSYLLAAVTAFDRALQFPAVLSVDDAFVRLIRGQVHARLAMAHAEDRTSSLAYLDRAVADLTFACESAPEKYGKAVWLASVLQGRADALSRMGRYSEALKDLDYALGTPWLRAASPDLTSQAEIKSMLIVLRQAVDDLDMEAIARNLPIALGHPEAGRVGALPIALAAKRLYANKPPTYDPALLARTIELMRSVDLSSMSDASARRLHLSVLAGLQFMLGRNQRRADSMEDAIASYVAAITASPEPPSPELLALHGDCSLKLGKQYARNGASADRVVALLEDAAESLTFAYQSVERSPGAVNEAFKLVVTYSKAGEAKLRLCALTGSQGQAQEAIADLERSYELGNTTPELLGLLGDAYYRAFKLSRNPSLLQQAIRYKRLARKAGAGSRENLSLSSRLSLMQWEYSENPQDLIDAICYAARAHQVAPMWPWPPFQLAEIADRAGSRHLEPALTAAKQMVPDCTLLALNLEDFRPSLLELGSRLVLETEEFTRKNLGGRQPVFVLEDDHGLLSSSYVFKETNPHNAMRDREVIESFSSFLKQRQLPGFRVPEALTVLPQGNNKVIYVMRRARGHHLGRAVVLALRENRTAPVDDFRRALTFLAAYHGWADFSRKTTPIMLDSFVRAYVGTELAMRTVDLPESTLLLLKQLGSVQQVTKKDAHPENWLIDEYGSICMLDFESSKSLPVLFEVAQLIEDYPLLGTGDENWTVRLNLCRSYLNALAELSDMTISIHQEAVEAIYSLFALLRIAFGIRYCTRPVTKETSSSVLRARNERVPHYARLLNWLATTDQEHGIRQFAQLLLENFGPSLAALNQTGYPRTFVPA